MKSNGWFFNWKQPFRAGYDVYGLSLKDNIQGAIAVKPKF